MTLVGFEPTSANTVDLKSTPLDQLGHNVIWCKNTCEVNKNKRSHMDSNHRPHG